MLPPHLYLNVDAGSECTVAAGVAENLSEDEDDNKQVSLRRPKMANKTLVRLESCWNVKGFMIFDLTINNLILQKQNKVSCFLCVMHMSVKLLHNLRRKPAAAESSLQYGKCRK